MPVITKRKPVYRLLFTMSEYAISKKVRVSREYVRLMRMEFLSHKDFFISLSKADTIKIPSSNVKEIKKFADEGIIKYRYKGAVDTVLALTSMGKRIILPLLERAKEGRNL